MMKRSYMFVVVFVLLFAGAADAQYPILDMIADKVIQKYQNVHVRAIVAAEKRAEAADGTGNHSEAPQ